MTTEPRKNRRRTPGDYGLPDDWFDRFKDAAASIIAGGDPKAITGESGAIEDAPEIRNDRIAWDIPGEIQIGKIGIDKASDDGIEPESEPGSESRPPTRIG